MTIRAPGTAEAFQKRQHASVTGEATAATQGGQTGTASPATGPERDRPAFPGSPGERDEPPPARGPRCGQGPPGSLWVGYAARELCGLALGASRELLRQPRFGGPRVFHRVCPAPPTRSHGGPTGSAAPARVPGQRAHARRHRPAGPLAPRDWRLDRAGSRAGGAIGCQTLSLKDPGRGGASSGRDATARLLQGRQAPSLTCFAVYSLLFSAGYEATCTRL